MASVQGSFRERRSTFTIPPHIETALSGSYGTSYGTMRSNTSESSMAHAGQLWKQQQETQLVQLAQSDREPLLMKEVEQDGKTVLTPVGGSTLYQTIMNSTNVLIGVGLLALPMGIKYSGWLCGMIFLLLSAIVTSYTATLLGKCMSVDVRIITFSDLALVAYGKKARSATKVLFTLELLAACVALMVLFADTLHLLFPGAHLSVNGWKILCGLILIPLSFMPLRWLSVSSFIGIASCFGGKSSFPLHTVHKV